MKKLLSSLVPLLLLTAACGIESEDASAQSSAAELVAPPQQAPQQTPQQTADAGVPLPPAGDCQGQQLPPRPPPEALAACANLQDGQACSFVTPNGSTISGHCKPGPNGEPLACAPPRP